MLSSVIGVAFTAAMIRNINDTCGLCGPGRVSARSCPATVDRLGAADLLFPFDSRHHRTLTGIYMLRQTSDWKARCGASLIGPIGRAERRPMDDAARISPAPRL